MSSTPSIRQPRLLVAVVLLVALQACSNAPKGHYLAAATQPRVNPEEVAAQTAAPDPQAPSINTQETYLRLVDRMQQEGLWFASLAHIDALEQQWGRSPHAIRLRADALRHTEQADASAALYRQLIGTPLEGAGYHGLGLLAGSRGDFEQAIQMLEQAQRRQPTDALLLSDLGYANLRAGRIPDARVPLMQALQLRPDSRQIQVNLALYLQASRQQEQANAMMEAHAMSEATRATIRETARRMTAGVPVTTPSTAPATSAAPVATLDDPQAPLALRASGWSSRAAVKAVSPSSSASAGALR